MDVGLSADTEECADVEPLLFETTPNGPENLGGGAGGAGGR